MDETPYLARAEGEIENVLGIKRAENHADGAPRVSSSRLARLAAEAHRRELLSEGQLARLLRLDRVTLRKLLDDANLDDPIDEGSSPGEPEGPGGA